MKKIIIAFVFLAISGSVRSETAIFSPTDDTFIDEVNPTSVNGSQQQMIIRCMNLGGYELDSLLKFDVSTIPAGSMINSATLNLYFFHYNDSNPTGNPLEARRITSSWSEGTTNWNNRPSYAGTASDTVSCPGSYVWIQWDVGDDVQNFVDGTTNYGWQIMDGSASSNSMIYFRSKEYTNPDVRPYLTVAYGTIYVDANAAGADNGTSWTDAFMKLQDALTTAVSGEEIWVADGTYKPDTGGGKTPGDPNATFQLISGVKLYGGFTGSETSLEERDWVNNAAILSGDINVADNNSDNSYHVVTASATDSTAVIDGFTITQGYARGLGPTSSGGGMYAYQGSPTVANCTFTENTAQRYGGGMYNDYNSDANVLKCIFADNVAEGGAGMTNDGSNPLIVNCIFEDNYTTSDDGGGMFNNEDSSPVLLNCVFVNNYSADNGGAIFNRGVGYDDDSCPTLINCSLGNNTAANYGGGMHTSNDAEERDPMVVNSIFWGNTAGFGTVQAQQIDGDTPVVTYSCIQDSDPNDGSIPFGGAANSNIDDDPLFRDAVGGDVRIFGGSPCIEAGDNSAVPADSMDIDGDNNTSEQTPLDLDLHLRFADGNCDNVSIVDMGAYELTWTFLGDLDSDCDVDFIDFGIFSSNWLAGK